MVGSRRTNHYVLIQDLLTLQADLWIWCHGGGKEKLLCVITTCWEQEAAERTRTRILRLKLHTERAVYLKVQDIGVSQETFVSFQVLNCLCILMTSKCVASGPWPTPFLYLALQSQSPGVQIPPAWCSSHRNCCCPWSWFAAFLGGKPHHQSYLCRMQLKPGKKEMRKEKPQWPQLHRVQSPKDSHLS